MRNQASSSREEDPFLYSPDSGRWGAFCAWPELPVKWAELPERRNLQSSQRGAANAQGRNFRGKGRKFRTTGTSGPTSEPTSAYEVRTPESKFIKRNKERKFTRNFRHPELPQIRAELPQTVVFRTQCRLQDIL